MNVLIVVIIIVLVIVLVLTLSLISCVLLSCALVVLLTICPYVYGRNNIPKVCLTMRGVSSSAFYFFYLPPWLFRPSVCGFRRSRSALRVGSPGREKNTLQTERTFCVLVFHVLLSPVVLQCGIAQSQASSACSRVRDLV